MTDSAACAISDPRGRLESLKPCVNLSATTLPCCTVIEEHVGKSGTVPTALDFAECRYVALIDAMQAVNKAVVTIQYKYTFHKEFERHLEWLEYALRVCKEGGFWV